MSWDRICAEIEAQPRLTAEEERNLRQAYGRGDQGAKQRVISATLRYALGPARRFASTAGRWETGDLLGEAVKAMSDAFDRWDGNGSFAGYVRARIVGSMKDFLRRKANLIRMPKESDPVLSLDSADDSGRTLLDLHAAPEIEAPPSFGLSPLEIRVLAATVLRQPYPGTPEQAAQELRLSVATVSRVLRGALRKSGASC